MNDSDSSDDDIPLAQFKIKEANPTSKQNKKSANGKLKTNKVKKDTLERSIKPEKERKSDYCDESTELGDQEEIHKEFIDGDSNITLVETNPIMDTKIQTSKSDDVKKKKRYFPKFGHVRSMFS